MNRNPPKSVIQILKQEVGFGCPVPGCGNPYLEWHHFDPPWCVENHHRAEGMIALCTHHHKKADSGAYTNEQLIEFKSNKANSEIVKGNFEWRRNKILTLIGGNFFYETPRPLVIDNHDVVSLIRDDNGYLLLNIEMLSVLKEERLIMKENCWENIGKPVDIKCPPSGKKLEIKYENGDYLSIEFYVVNNEDLFFEKFNCKAPDLLEFPLTISEINFNVGGLDLKASPIGTNIQNNQFTGCFSIHCSVGMMLNLGIKWRQNWNLVPVPESRLSPCPCNSGYKYKHCHGQLT
ncbi:MULTISPECIES: SEC-C metal-binding domain-containing protein [Proteus]|uniref:HNH endonuclease n=1 Tax=Proteus columbae TaxID=1987580 RepID=A0A6I7DBT1_9GAMM|nr:SEC-C metal-binding domain-containing protein [Proteus columbae]QHN10207.1 HNH endonuclease [Proteus columbae]